MASLIPAPQARAKRHLNLSLWLAMLLAAAVVIPRSYLITRAQGEHADDEYHVARGLIFWEDRSGLQRVQMNDPPLGEALGIFPLWLAHCWKEGTLRAKSFFWGHRFSANTILSAIGLWKSLLFLPLIGIVFAWARALYGGVSAWLAVAIFLIEPTIAAHTPLASIDVLGMEAIIIACFLAWRYFQRPTVGRLIAADFATAAAMLIKHTAIIMPIVGFAYAFVWWVVLPWKEGDLRRSWREQWGRRIGATLAGITIISFSIWALLRFDQSRALPSPAGSAATLEFRKAHPIVGPMLDRPLPGGLYIRSFLQAMAHAERGHMGYLLGQMRREGWWYYFPVVSTYKVPIGIGVILLIGLISVLWIKPRWDEWGLFIPMILLTGLMLTSHINIGWRHFLPPLAFMMMLACRSVARKRHPERYAAKDLASNFRPDPSASTPQDDYGPGWMLIAVWIAVGLAWIDTLRFHPDYLSYISWPRQEGWRAISDSNVDWGQDLKYIRKWLDQHRSDRRRVFVRSNLWFPTTEYVKQRLGNRVTVLTRPPRLPAGGVLIISPVSLVGLYETLGKVPRDPYKVLRDVKPTEILGHSMMVFDLDKLRPPGPPFNWGPQRPLSAIERRLMRQPRPATTRPTTRRAPPRN